MRAKSLVIGLDGADLDVVRSIGPTRLPALHALMERGAFAHIESIRPPATLPNWATFLTGVNPGVHGVFDFTVRNGYWVRFTGGAARACPTIMARLDALGLACACIGFPGTWPPERLRSGIVISGWDAPVAFEADRSFVWPEDLYETIQARFGTLRFDDVDEFHADSDGWLSRLPGALTERVVRKTALASFLLGTRAWDVFAVYFGESDTAAHYLWNSHDRRSPRRLPRVPEAAARGLSQVYEALDHAVGELVARAGGERVEVTVVSDHGSGGSSDKVLYVNRALEAAGLLRMRRNRAYGALRKKIKDLALTSLAPRLRERLFRFHDAALPSVLESQVRFGSIDMKNTVAFSDELNYFPAVHINVRGREPLGIVDPADRMRATRDVEAALTALRDPWTGKPVIAHVHRREELFDGPHVDRAPDLLLDLHLDDDYSYNLMPSTAAPPGTGPWRKLAPEEHGGRKGRSLPGSHRPKGLFIASGPRVASVGEVNARIADATSTLLARMDVAPAPDADGRVLWEVLESTGGQRSTLGDPLVANTRTPRADIARVEARLRALGYIE